MSDFLASLLARGMGAAPAIRPRLPSLFESPAGRAPMVEANEVAEAVVLRPAPPTATSRDTVMGGEAQVHLAPPPAASPGRALTPPQSTQPESGRATVMATAAMAGPVVPPPTPTHPPSVETGAKPRSEPATGMAPSIPRMPAPPLPAAVIPLSRPVAVRVAEPQRPPEPPSVRITIGRVEVRAVPANPPAARPGRRASPKLSLEDYLRPRAGGAR